MNENLLSIIIKAISYVAVAVIPFLTANQLISYKVEELSKQFDELKKKVEEHNGVVQRTAVLERDMVAMFKKYDELTDGVEKLKDANNEKFNEIIYLLKREAIK